MEVYILDSLLRRQTVVDSYESLIWTERVSAWGDFELTISSTPATRNLFIPNTKLAIDESYRVMTVETVEDGVDGEGLATLTVKGRSLEFILDDRVAKQTMNKLVTPPDGAQTTAEWVLTGTPKQVMNTMFDTVVRNGALTIYDQIPFLQPGSIFPADTIPEVIDPITWNQDPDSLYTAMKAVAEAYNLGFRLVRNFDASELYFDVFTGIDRTTNQTAYPPVVFSPNLDNLQNTKELTSIEGAKNVAYVFSTQGAEMVYGADADTTVSGFDRHAMLVRADDLPASPVPTPEQISAWLIQKGREELYKNRSFSAFDGEISQHSEYKYGTHYGLGDLVELQNIDGVANIMRVTEQIFVSDKEGVRSYPTLTIFVFVNMGSWLSWNANKTWGDFETDNTTVWANQP